MKEPLSHFYSKFGFDPAAIKQLVIGEVYVGLMLENGNIGVCSTLQFNVNLEIPDLNPINLDNVSHRIVLNAYYNAFVNYSNDFSGSADIFEEIDFKQYKSIVMIGYFQSLLQKFEKENINLTVFDNRISGPEIAGPEDQMIAIENAGALILTGTSIFNKSFSDIMSLTNPHCDIFVLGPSTILHTDMFHYGNIKVLFGALFEKNDLNPLQIIQQGKGTRDFLPYMEKVYINCTL